MTKTTTHASLLSTLAASMIGHQVVLASDADRTLKIKELDSETGKMRDGSDGQYLLVQDSADEATIVRLHPKDALALLRNGESGEYKMPEVLAAKNGGEVTEEAPAKKARKPAKKAAVKAAKPAAKKAATKKTAAKKEVTKREGPSKKEQTIKIVEAAIAKGAARKDTIAKLIEKVGLSEAGANTYYQNVKSGAWASA